jgi:hypothetical protein
MNEFSANGVNGQVHIQGNKVLLTRKGLLSKLSFGSSTKEILIKNITAIQMKDAGFTNGYIQFVYSGSSESKGRVFSASQDENSVVFNTWQKKDFHKIKKMIDDRREEIENRMYQNTVPQPQQGHSASDLEKFAELRDKGIITNDEFEAKKKQILGL